MKKILSIFAMIFVGSSFLVLAQPNYASAASCNQTFFGMPAWHRGLTDENCNIKKISEDGEGGVTLTQFFWTVVANIIDCVFRIAGTAAVGFIVYAGFLYMLATGDSGRVAAAKTTLINAVVGLAIAILASTIVNLVLGVF